MVYVIPVGQKRLTNVAVVKVKQGKVTLELACYRNKVIAWRLGQEKVLSEVLQVDNIFTSVDKGAVAKKADLKKLFPNKSYDDIVKEILDKGEIQVTDEERTVLSEALTKQVCEFVSERVLDPQTGGRIAEETIGTELKRLGFAVQWNGGVKPQGLLALALLDQELSKFMVRGWYEIEVRVSDPRVAQDVIPHYKSKCECERISFLSNTHLHLYIHPKNFGQFVKLTNSLDKAAEVVRKEGMVNPAPFLAEREKGKLFQGSLFKKPVPQTEVPAQSQTVAATELVSGPSCSTCATADGSNGVFSDVTAYRKHCKTGWHLFNSKRKARGLDAVDLDLFMQVEEDIGGFAADEGLER